ncbi:MAG TPA: PPC domain-containing protein [Anaerolineae bacterium]|nr:PPC domain-containing protein [Anaerolineae bacterium]
MRRAHVILLITTGSLGLLLVLLSVVAGRATPILAASRPLYAASNPWMGAHLPSYQGTINCTLATTTTDSLESAGTYNDNSASAAPLAGYTGLALASGIRLQVVPPKEDWFRLDNAEIGASYKVEALPDKTTNYNLGIVVYNASLTPIVSDTDSLDTPQARVTLEAGGYGPYFFKVYQLTPQCTGETYHLNITVTRPTPSPEPDDYEPNDSLATAYKFPVGASISATDANFVPYSGPGPDQDWYGFYVKAGRSYRASTSNLDGVDTYVEIYTEGGQLGPSDNDSGGGFDSKVEWAATYTGYYYVHVSNLISGSKGSYDLKIEEIAAPPTETPEPTQPGPTPIPGMDSFEPNYDFAHASTIAANVTYSANFIPWSGGTEDNDFYKIWIKPGLHFICATSELAPGVDTNIIVYDGNRNAIGGNDDVTLGDYSSRFAYFSTYEGWLYVLVGHGGRLPMTDVKDSTYKIRCEMQVPGQATATSTPEEGEAPPPPATEVPPAPTSRPPEELTVRPLTTPTPASAVTPAPRFIPITLLVYYDAKDDRQPGAGEGIAGISAQAYDATTNQLLAQGFTDEQGNLQFTVSAKGPVRVAVPFFGFSQLVAGEGASIYLRVPPQPLPGGAP